MTTEELNKELLDELTKYISNPSVVNIIVGSYNSSTIFSVNYLNNT